MNQTIIRFIIFLFITIKSITKKLAWQLICRCIYTFYALHFAYPLTLDRTTELLFTIHVRVPSRSDIYSSWSDRKWRKETKSSVRSYEIPFLINTRKYDGFCREIFAFPFSLYILGWSMVYSCLPLKKNHFE